jgi:hypothetical protein
MWFAISRPPARGGSLLTYLSSFLFPPSSFLFPLSSFLTLYLFYPFNPSSKVSTIRRS